MKSITIENITKSYRELELPIGAVLDDIEKAYKTLRVKVHPDKYSSQEDKIILNMTNKFIAVKKSYEFLKENYLEILALCQIIDDFSMVSLKSKKVKAFVTYGKVSQM